MVSDSAVHSTVSFFPRWGFLGCLVLAAFLPYLGILNTPFVFDDVKLVQENGFFQRANEEPILLVESLDITSRRWDEEELRPNYRPLRFLSYFIDYQLTKWWFGEWAAGGLPTLFFHLSNVLLHVLNTLLIAAVAAVLLRQLFQRENDPSSIAALSLGAFATALLFALHPIQTEAVTYVSGRRDVLSTTFFLIALYLGTRDRPERIPGVASVIGVAVCFALGFLTKEMVITFPAVLLLIDIWRGARWSGTRIATQVLLWLIAGLFISITLGNERLIAEAQIEPDQSVWLTACRYVVRYLGLAVLPISQSVDYSYSVILPSTGWISPWTTLPTLMLVVALVFGSVALLFRWLQVGRPGEHSRLALFSFGGVFVLWFVGTLAPVLQFVPTAERFAERFVYLPVIGLLLFAGGLFAALSMKERWLARGGLAFLAVICLVATLNRNGDWASPLTLWRSAVQAQPRCGRAHLGCANALRAAGLLRDAVAEYTSALEVLSEKPDLSLHHGYILQALTFRASANGELGNTEDAVNDYRRVLTETDVDGTRILDSSKYTILHFELAAVLFNDEQFDAAEVEFRKVIEIGSPPALVGSAHYLLGKILLSRGEDGDGLLSLERAYETLPLESLQKLHVAIELLDLLIVKRDLDKAEELATAALRHAEGKVEALHLEMRRAKMADRRGDVSQTISILKEILRRDSTYVPALVTLGGIQSNRGEVEEAETHFRRALELLPGNREAIEGLRMLKLRVGMSKDPDNGDDPQAMLSALEKRAKAHLERGELLAARKVYAELLTRSKQASIAAQEVGALSGLGDLESRLGRPKAAREYLERALKLSPDDPVVLLRLADFTRDGADTRDESLGFYRRYMNSLSSGEVKPRVYVHLAELTVANDPDGAIEYCRRAEELGVDGPLLDAALGYAYSGVGEWEQALDAFNRYLKSADSREQRKIDEVRDFVRETVLENLLEE